MRLDRFLSNLKHGSRSEATEFIKKGRVKVNGNVILNSHYKIDPKKDQVFFDDSLVYYRDLIILAINKPKDYLSANKDDLHKTVMELIKEPYNNFDFKIAGRLDLDTEGLMILTTSGSVAHYITSPNSKISKVYEVLTDKDTNDYLKLLEGVIIKDGKNEDYLAKALNIEKTAPNSFIITIDEGKYHQVKRMFRYLDLEVINLKRIKIGNISLGNLKPGEYIEIDKDMI